MTFQELFAIEDCFKKNIPVAVGGINFEEKFVDIEYVNESSDIDSVKYTIDNYLRGNGSLDDVGLYFADKETDIWKHLYEYEVK